MYEKSGGKLTQSLQKGSFSNGRIYSLCASLSLYTQIWLLKFRGDIEAQFLAGRNSE